MLQTIAILLISILIPTCLHSQIITEEYSQKAMKPDSLFTEFEYPSLPKYVKQSSLLFKYQNKEKLTILSIQIVICFTVNSKGEIRQLIVNPLYQVGNDIPKNDKLWKDFENNIREASKKWKVKSLYFPDGYEPQNPYINTSPGFRPYTGNQYHFMILNYTCDPHFGGLASFLYWMQPP